MLVRGRYFAEGLSEMAAQSNESVVPFGLISSSWCGQNDKLLLAKGFRFR